MILFSRRLAPALIPLIAAALLAACASKDDKSKAAADAASTPTAAAASTSPPAPAANALPQPSTTAAAPLDPGALSDRSIFYDFDDYQVKPEYFKTVESHARYLIANKARRVTIEGNTDERGSREYNLALGQRRADSVRSRLQLLGVPDAQVETVSYGEERPRGTGHDEQSWSQNRRADIAYK